MLDLFLRNLVSNVTRYLACHLGQWFSPNQLTVGSLLCGLASAFYVAQGQMEIGLLLWGFNRALDGLDGAVARLFNLQSDFGGHLDIVSDFIVYAALPAALKAPCLPWLLAVYVANAVSLFKLSALLETRTGRQEVTSVQMPPALIEGFETIIVYTLALALPAYSVAAT